MIELHWSSPFFITMASTGIVFWVAGLWVKKRPPKKINDLMGYRTQRSKSSQEAWDYSQQYSSDISIRVGQLMMLAGGLWMFLPSMHPAIETVFACGLIIWGCIHLLTATEKELKRRFG